MVEFCIKKVSIFEELNEWKIILPLDVEDALSVRMVEEEEKMDPRLR